MRDLCDILANGLRADPFDPDADAVWWAIAGCLAALVFCLAIRAAGGF